MFASLFEFAGQELDLALRGEPPELGGVLERGKSRLPALRKAHAFGDEHRQEVRGLPVAALRGRAERVQSLARAIGPMDQEMLPERSKGCNVAARGGAAQQVGRLRRAACRFESTRCM